MSKLVLEKAEEPEIKLPTSAGSSKKQESSRKISISALLTMPEPLTVWITINAGMEEAQAGIKIARRNINNLRYADDTTFMAESEEELKNLLMKVKEESEKVALKLNIQETKIMASGPIISWEIDGETVADFIFGGCKIAADGDCSHKIKRCLLLRRTVMTNLDSILKSIKKHYFANKGPSDQGNGFSSGHVMDVRVGLWRKLSAKELMLLNCSVGEDSWESLGLQGDPISPS